MNIDYSDPANRSHASTDVVFKVPPSDLYITHNIDDMMKKINLIANTKQIYMAINRAAKETRNWLQTQLRKELSLKTGIERKLLKPRFRRGNRNAVSAWSNLAILWVGVNPMPAHWLSFGKNTTWDRSRGGGVKVGTRYFAGAFMAKIYSSETKIWRRMGKKLFPVILMTVPIEKEMEEILPKYEKLAAYKFEQRFEHQLKFALGWFS